MLLQIVFAAAPRSTRRYAKKLGSLAPNLEESANHFRSAIVRVLVPKVRRAMVLEGGAFQKFSSVFLLQARAAPIPKNAEDARSSLPCWKGEMRRRNGRQRC
ncbi:hypothetical protein LSM04_003737 [Trypanosoma melophagium]|uniref:uncharacterized protein n=1 Tax=Trypanosoma melophagium TaxID=715481 RepID=UPI00351A8CD2|nr:hypothetical protein LSM04_003737 [Trypanosoma melophagium]